MTLDSGVLDQLIKKTIFSVEESHQQVFDIAEEARKECLHLKKEIEQLQREVVEIIEKNDKLDAKLRRARIKLSDVSKRFDSFSEENIRAAYDETNQLQIEHHLLKEKESQLRQRRDDLQFRLRNLEQTVERAEKLTTQMGVVLGYLKGEIKQAGQLLEDARMHQQLGLKVIQAQEEERRRVAREIHDGPAQSMANAVLRTELAERVFSQGDLKKASAELKEVKEMLRESIADVRRIIFDLKPMALDDLGLVPTIKKYIEVVQRQTNTEIEFKYFGQMGRLPSMIEVAVFRLMQEALSNVLKHAKARHSLIKLEGQAEQLFIVIEDDGVGFNQEDKAHQGYGILGMKERVRLLEGQIQIQSNARKGSKIFISIPMEKLD